MKRLSEVVYSTDVQCIFPCLYLFMFSKLYFLVALTFDRILAHASVVISCSYHAITFHHSCDSRSSKLMFIFWQTFKDRLLASALAPGSKFSGAQQEHI